MAIEYRFATEPRPVGDGRFSLRIVARRLLNGAYAYIKAEVIPPLGTIDIEQYVTDNIESIWSGIAEPNAGLGDWIKASKAPLIPAYFQVMTVVYNTLLQGDTLETATGAGAAAISQVAGISEDYVKIRDAINNATQEQKDLLLAQSLVVIAGILAGTAP